MHLGAAYIEDPRAHQARIVSFLRSLKDKAESVYILGDALDYWYEYRTVVPRGYVRFFGALAELADAGVEIVWLTGNHDIWLFDYLRDEIGISVYDPGADGLVREISGKKFFLAHGDAFGPRSVSFRLIQRLFRNRVCQKLYSSIHPRWTVGFAHSWSSHSRKSGMMPGDESERYFKTNVLPGLKCFCRKLIEQEPDLDFIMLGHHHIVFDEAVSDRCRLLVIGDWISHFSYAVFDGENVEIKQYDSQSFAINQF